MSEQQIHPTKITKPIQLLAAWLVGLILVNGSFLLAAQQVQRPEWASGVLVIASVLNVPIFLFALFLLQTKFRPQMQEDSFYAEYLQREHAGDKVRQESVAVAAEASVVTTTVKLVKSIGAGAAGKEIVISRALRDMQTEMLVAKHGSSRCLSVLLEYPNNWEDFSSKFRHNGIFAREMEGLIADGLVIVDQDSYYSARLTDVGMQVAKAAEEKRLLYSQGKPKAWKIARAAPAKPESE